MPIIVSTIKALDQKGDTVEKLIADAIPEIQKLSGCEKYALHRLKGRSRRGEFRLIEKWTTDADLANYGLAPVLIKLHDDLESLIHALDDYVVVEAVVYGDPAVGAI
ncbi:hypothetical protein GCM10022234_05140 [Aeromicrobium panaciterrae]|uniref:putative quinol monooxygenase n=1 Tax=Aeromicrobium panaciterrae TaxID=363861 RepID=UPI0031D74905